MKSKLKKSTKPSTTFADVKCGDVFADTCGGAYIKLDIPVRDDKDKRLLWNAVQIAGGVNGDLSEFESGQKVFLVREAELHGTIIS